MEKKLALRLEAGVKAWTKALEGKSQQEADIATDTDTTTAHKLGGDPQIQTLIHEIRITNQVIYVNPSVEEARFNVMQQLFAWENVVLLQTRIQSSRYQVNVLFVMKVFILPQLGLLLKIVFFLTCVRISYLY